MLLLEVNNKNKHFVLFLLMDFWPKKYCDFMDFIRNFVITQTFSEDNQKLCFLTVVKHFFEVYLNAPI